MKRPLTVNQAIDELSSLTGKDVSIAGILRFDFENVSINHSPSSERKDDYQSSIWLQAGFGSLGFDKSICERLNGKRVLVQGTLFKANPEVGAGHMGLWPAELLARTLERAYAA